MRQTANRLMVTSHTENNLSWFSVLIDGEFTILFEILGPVKSTSANN